MTARSRLGLVGLATAVMLGITQFALAHGGGGGGGGGHGGGGGGHGGGFGGGHGGGHGGFGGGHYGGGHSYGGGHYGGYSGGYHGGASSMGSTAGRAGTMGSTHAATANSFLSRHGGTAAGTGGTGSHQAFHSGSHTGMNGMNGHHYNHMHNNFNNSFFFPFGLYGYGFGYPWFWYGLGGYGYGGYGYGYGNSGYYYQNANQYASAQQQPVATAGTGDAGEFAAAGEAAFKAGDYETAVKEWRHALVESPNNGALVLLLAQGLFATGKYDEAAGAAQAALNMLPQDKWGVVVSNYTELYRSNNDFTAQLRALESAVEKNSTPANEFLLGYQYGYLGYSKQAVRELDKGLTLLRLRKDETARKLRAIFVAKLPEGERPSEPAAATNETQPTPDSQTSAPAAPEATTTANDANGPALTAP